jgi:hypothetical protein
VDEYRSLRFTGGISLTGFGLLSAVLGSVLGLRAIVDKSRIGSQCNKAGYCNLPGYTIASETQDFTYGSNASFVVAAAALGAGIPLLLTGLPKKASAPRVGTLRPHLSAWMLPSPRGIGAVVRW